MNRAQEGVEQVRRAQNVYTAEQSTPKATLLNSTHNIKAAGFSWTSVKPAGIHSDPCRHPTNSIRGITGMRQRLDTAKDVLGP